MHYCGVVAMQGSLQLAMLEEVRTPEPPIRLSALFYEPGSAADVARELLTLDEVVIGVGAPLADLLRDLPTFAPAGEEHTGAVEEGAYGRFPLFETNADGVFYALQGRRLPAKRHPFGMLKRIEELAGDHVTDDGGDLWHRRIEEIDAVVCALCAHRYAVGHASWLGDPKEGVVVLPGASIPSEFSRQGVMP